MRDTTLTPESRATVEKMLREYGELTQEALRRLPSISPGLCGFDGDVTLQTLWSSEQYSLMAGGKRIRPTLVLEVCRMLGGDVNAAIPFACAVEMVHTYSLIHDDLPCMDNDDLRRGKPTNHKVYGEAIATLAGDGLLTDAFGVVASNDALSAESRIEAVSVLSAAAGSMGMVGGQLIDLENEDRPLSLEHLKLLHARKTGAMFRASLLLGAIAAGYSQTRDVAIFDALTEYAESVGLAFQVLDDILDVTADPALMGKTLGKDASEHKNTFLKYYTIPEARTLAEELTRRAVQAIEPLDHSERLCALAYYLQQRDH